MGTAAKWGKAPRRWRLMVGVDTTDYRSSGVMEPPLTAPIVHYRLWMSFIVYVTEWDGLFTWIDFNGARLANFVFGVGRENGRGLIESAGPGVATPTTPTADGRFFSRHFGRFRSIRDFDSIDFVLNRNFSFLTRLYRVFSDPVISRIESSLINLSEFVFFSCFVQLDV